MSLCKVGVGLTLTLTLDPKGNRNESKGDPMYKSKSTHIGIDM